MMSTIATPPILKLLYALINDNVPLYGSNRKSYIVLMSSINTITLFTLYFIEVKSALLVTVLFTISVFCFSFSGTAVCAMMIIKTRNDPVHGSQEL